MKMQLTADYEKLPATPHSFISKEQGRKVVKRRENETLDVIKTLDRVYLGNQCETNCSLLFVKRLIFCLS